MKKSVMRVAIRRLAIRRIASICVWNRTGAKIRLIPLTLSQPSVPSIAMKSVTKSVLLRDMRDMLISSLIVSINALKTVKALILSQPFLPGPIVAKFVKTSVTTKRASTHV